MAATESNNQKIRIRLTAYDYKVIDKSAKEIVKACRQAHVKVVGPIPLQTKKNVFTVIKSPHVFKKGREQFEMRIHKRLIEIHSVNPKVVDSLINLDLPAGCEAEFQA